MVVLLWLCKTPVLDMIHHQGIRLALGAFRTSPADSLLVETNEPSLKDRNSNFNRFSVYGNEVLTLFICQRITVDRFT